MGTFVCDTMPVTMGYTLRTEEFLLGGELQKLYPPLLAQILAARGVAGGDEGEVFLHPDYSRDLHDPFLLADMDRVVGRILKAIRENEHIVIYGDFDSDGVPGSVILHDFLKRVGHERFSHYFPHREDEGFGFHAAAMGRFKNEGAGLIITVDCGITDIEAAQAAREEGIDVIITDHHVPPAELPPAFAIINPKRSDCSYPFKMLCGAGVVFKIIQALRARRELLPRGGEALTEAWEKWLLDLVGLATLADMVPLTGENRMLAYFGLTVLRKSRRPGLRALVSSVRVSQKDLTEDDIGFMVVPRLNAASRMSTADEAFKLLTSTEYTEAAEIAAGLGRLNDERKYLVASIVKEARRVLREREMTHPLVVVGNPEWRPSVLGPVATSLSEWKGVPAFVWGRTANGVIKGSCRSDGAVDVVSLMRRAQGDVFKTFGGHSASGGFSVLPERIHELEERLAVALGETPQRVVDGSDYLEKRLVPDEVTWELYRMIERIGPFGEGNPKPLFLLSETPTSVKMFGKGGVHLEVTYAKGSGERLRAVGFFMSDHPRISRVGPGKSLDAVVSLERSVFRDVPELRLRIVDILE